MPTRVTINEIARRAGVSKGAVSYALNGRPGVSDVTRDRILTVARELGWAPNRTARLLSGSRTDTFGLVLTRDPRSLGNEPFYMEFIAGLESVLSPRGYALLLHVSPSLPVELDIYARWQSERRVDAVAVVDLRVADRRPDLLRTLGLPAVFVGDPSVTDGFPTVWIDDAAATAEAVATLGSLGHRHLARVAGLSEFVHVRVRNQAFRAACDLHALTGDIVHADFSVNAGRAATGELMARSPRPTALLFDNDLMAVAALAELTSLGIAVPDEINLLAGGDSALCRNTHPELSAMSHDVVSFGASVAERLCEVVGGRTGGQHLHSTPRFRPRGSTAAVASVA